MPSTDDPVLLDNCAISACLSAGGWKALCARYRLETVEEIAAEAGTGHEYREVVDGIEFREQVHVHQVSNRDRLQKTIEYADLQRMDEGERDLWVHALGRVDSWILCGPDNASVRFAVISGNAGRLISLEELFERIGFSAAPLGVQHRKKWLREKISQYKLELEFELLKTNRRA